MRRPNARKPDSTTNNMESTRHQIRSSNLFSRNPKHAKSTKYLIIALVSILIGISTYYTFFMKAGSPVITDKYAIVIDGGSTGTRIHVFRYRIRDGNAVVDFGEGGLRSMKVNPGLSAYAEDPEAAGGSMRELVEFGKKEVPRGRWAETEIRLMATAGLRMLEVGTQERVLEACRKALRASVFRFQDEWASVITGSDEGVYAWVVANYALGTLGGDPLQTTGIIELGGASAQVTFVSSELMPPEFSRTVQFGNVTYNLYSHSFLHFGQNAAFETFRESLASGDYKLAAEFLSKGIQIDPCTPKGYLHNVESWKLSPGSLGNKDKYSPALQSRGNFSECRSAALMLLQKGKDKCPYEHCLIGSTFMPKLQGKFLATENFFYTSKFFGLGTKAFLSELMMAGHQFCGGNWSKLKKKYQSLNDEDLLRYCFSSSYIVALLHDSLGIALDDKRLAVANQVGNVPLDWALGAFILQSTSHLNVQHHDWIATIINDDSPTLFTLAGIFIILMFTAFSISKLRKPQLKTIYDLEKGRYIVTRISRW